MRVALVAPSGVPFVVGGAEKLWWGLTQHVNRHMPHEMELIKLPSPERNFWDIAESYERFSLLDLSHFDAVISTKYPAWMVAHPNHVVYLQHRLRGLYDTWPLRMPTRPSRMPEGLRPLWRLLESGGQSRDLLPEIFGRVRELRVMEDAGADWVRDATALPGALVRALVHKLDGIGLAPDAVRSYWAISRVVAERDGYFPPGVTVGVLPHPSNLEGLHTGAGEFVFTASRLDAPKRLDLLVRAYRGCQSPLPLCVAGDGPEAGRLRELAAGDDRIRLLGRLTDDDLVEHYSRAVLVPFVPEREDMGLITLEAMSSGKPVLTVSDAGGVTEFVNDGVNGRVVAPDVTALTLALNELLGDAERLQAMGRAALQTAGAVTWTRTAAALLDAAEVGLARARVSDMPMQRAAVAFRTGRRRLLVLNTFGVYPPDSGGKKRVFYLYQGLAKHWDVTLLNLGTPGSEALWHEFGEHFRELRIPPSERFVQLERALTRQLRRPVTDVAAVLYATELEQYVQAFRQLAALADVVVAAHVYMGPLIESVWNGPVWYDAHNVEADLKADVLGVPRIARLSAGDSMPLGTRWDTSLAGDAAALHAVECVAMAESRLVRRAERVLAVSDVDRARMADLYGRALDTLELVPNGTELPADAWLEPGRREGLKQSLGLGGHPLAVFVGAYHGPNLAAVEAVLAVARSCPDWRFLVVGSVCQHLERHSPAANVYALGLVTEKELRVVLRAADVGLNPMQQGSGTNLKVLDYASHGALVLSTPVGVRGLTLLPGVHYVECETDDFARQLSRLAAATPGPETAMRTAARAVAAATYDWSVVAAGVVAQG